MALPRPDCGEVFNIHPTGEQYTEFFTRALIRSDELEVARLVLPDAAVVKRHAVPGDTTLQCIEGHIELEAGEQRVYLKENEMTYIAAGTAHTIRAMHDAVVLLTMVLHKSQGATFQSH